MAKFETLSLDKQKIFWQKKVRRYEKRIRHLTNASNNSNKVINFFQKYGAIPMVLPVLVGSVVSIVSLINVSKVSLLVPVVIHEGLQFLFNGLAIGLVPDFVANILNGAIVGKLDKCKLNYVDSMVSLQLVDAKINNIDLNNEQIYDITENYKNAIPLVENNNCAYSLKDEYEQYKDLHKKGKDRQTKKQTLKDRYFKLLLRRENVEKSLKRSSKIAIKFNKGWWILVPFSTVFFLLVLFFDGRPFSLDNPASPRFFPSLMALISPFIIVTIGYVARSVCQRKINNIDVKIRKIERKLNIQQNDKIGF